MKKVVFLLGILLFSSGVLASMTINNPLDTYSLGDKLGISLDGVRGAASGNLDIDLICGNVSVNLVRIPARAFSLDEDQSYSVPYKVLDKEDLGVDDLGIIVGNCHTVASLGSDIVVSNDFKISNEVDVSLSLDKTEYSPGDVGKITIEATKTNGDLIDGLVEATNGTDFASAIENGFVEKSFGIGENAESGFYTLNIYVYDRNADGVLNSGTESVSYFVKQVPTSLVLSLSDEEVLPGSNFTIGAEVFDQSGINMDGTVLVKLISPELKEVDEKIVSGEFSSIDLPTNATAGAWNIVAQFGDLTYEREFKVLPLQKVSFEFEDSVLVIKNIGNTLYNKTINVNIGDEVKNLKLNIGVGDIRKFALEAPVGDYDVVVGDGESKIAQRVLLTGKVISVSDFKDGSIFGGYMIIWIFLIVVLGAIAIVFSVRYKKTRKIGGKVPFWRKWFSGVRGNARDAKVMINKEYTRKVPAGFRSHVDNTLHFTKKSPAAQSLDSKNYSKNDKTLVDFTKGKGLVAESVSVLQGEKHISSIVVLNIKNYDEMNDMAKDSLNDVIENSKGKGVVDYRNDYIFVVFTPAITKTYRNENLAVRCAMKLSSALGNYNKKFTSKIDFGVGVHVGELIVAKEKNKLKYTAIGNAVSFAKRMSDIDSGKVVVSEVVRKKLLRDLKVVKGKSVGENLTYVVSEVKDRSGDAERLKDLLKRSGNA